MMSLIHGSLNNDDFRSTFQTSCLPKSSVSEDPQKHMVTILDKLETHSTIKYDMIPLIDHSPNLY